MQEMTSRERFLIAMTGGQPDRVPCSPDFSNMIPCRLTGKPFWDIYLNSDPPLWRAYIDAARHFGIDPWFPYASPRYTLEDEGCVQQERSIISRADDRIVEQTRTVTPEGEMTSRVTYYRDNPPTESERPLKDLQAQRRQIKHLYRMPTGADFSAVREMKKYVGPDVAFGGSVGYPGFQSWVWFTQGQIETLSYAMMDCPDVLEELYQRDEAVNVKRTEIMLDSGLYDYLLLGGSGTITLSSPEIFDRYALPTIKKITKMCRQAGVATMLHSCGKEMHLIQRCAEETDLSCVNPLEIPPMGDSTLSEAKRLYGDKIALMGNLHTTEVMLRGSVEDVKKAARQAIDDAAKGGGFILSTGDQCGRDTPDENLRAMVEVCKTYGRYQ